MSGEERRFFSGESLAQAVMAAARHFHVPPEELAYRQRERKHGFTHRARSVVIEVDPEALRRTETGVGAAMASTPSAPPRESVRSAGSSAGPEVRSLPAATPRPDRGVPRPRSERPERRERVERSTARIPLIRATEEHRAVARQAAERLAELAGLEVQVETALVAERVRVELAGADAAWMLSRGREPFEAFEVLLRRMLRTPAGEAIPVEIDSQGMRAEREGELRSLAAAAAIAVRRSGRPVELDPLPPLERRVIHMALADATDLVTESRGEGRERWIEVRLRQAVATEEPQSR